MLKEGTDPSSVEAKFPPIVKENESDFTKQTNSSTKYSLMPLRDIHLYSNFMMEPGATGDGKTVYLLFGIAFFIILIAWVNYINLATARAIGRAKEVGVRKTVGSNRNQLIGQFFLESALFKRLCPGFSLRLDGDFNSGFQSIVRTGTLVHSLFKKYLLDRALCLIPDRRFSVRGLPRYCLVPF